MAHRHASSGEIVELKALGDALAQHVTHALRTTATFEVYTENEDGEEEVVETSSRAITPTDEEWTIAAEVAAVLKLPFVLTQKLQGLQTPP